MNVIYDHQTFSAQRYGGISRYFYEVANSLGRNRGTNVEIFAPLYVNEYFKADDKVTPTGVYVPPIPKTMRLIRAFDNLASLGLKLRRNVDIFHETYYGSLDYCPKSAKRFVTVYDMIHERLPAYFRGSDNTAALKAKAVSRADHVICISEHTRRDLIEILGVPKEKTSVVYLGYTLSATADAVLPGVITRPYILYVGFRDAYKNWARLLHAYAQSPLLKKEFMLVFFGGRPFSAAEKEKLNSLSLGPGNVAHCSGGDDVLGALYAGATAFVYPSLYEGFGIPPLEAMSFGCPVVCSNTSSIPEVVGEAAELFDPEDENDMRCALERVVSSGERRAELVKLGRARCQQFSWAKCADETFDVYSNALRK